MKFEDDEVFAKMKKTDPVPGEMRRSNFPSWRGIKVAPVRRFDDISLVKVMS